MKARITSIGSYLPEKVLSNQDLEKLVDTSDEWIVSRTGISERRIAREDQASSDLGFEAAKIALEKGGLKPDEIDLIITATSTPDYLMPSTACLIQSRLGAQNAFCFDLQAACTGFLYALSVAKAYVESGACKRVLLVACEKMSAFMDYQDRSTCILFGDGASACIISGEGEGFLLEGMKLGSDGDLSPLIIVPAGGSKDPASNQTVLDRRHFFKMEGKEVFKHAVRKMERVLNDCLQEANVTADEISYLVPHQANDRILQLLAKNLNLPLSRVARTLHKYGNTSAPSPSITLDELLQKESLEKGERVVLVAFGAGLTWGAALLKKI